MIMTAADLAILGITSYTRVFASICDDIVKYIKINFRNQIKLSNDKYQSSVLTILDDQNWHYSNLSLHQWLVISDQNHFCTEKFLSECNKSDDVKKKIKQRLQTDKLYVDKDGIVREIYFSTDGTRLFVNYNPINYFADNNADIKQHINESNSITF